MSYGGAYHAGRAGILPRWTRAALRYSVLSALALPEGCAQRGAGLGAGDPKSIASSGAGRRSAVADPAVAAAVQRAAPRDTEEIKDLRPACYFCAGAV